MNPRILALIVLVGSLASGARLDALPVYVKIAPPAARVEVRVASPGPGFVWVEGYHRWHGGAYVWVPGRWTLPPRPGAVWVPGHWKGTRRGWVWKAGHWR